MSKRDIVHLHNYKLFDELEVAIPSDADVIIVTADNDCGKSSFIISLKEAYGLQVITPKPLKEGEEKGANTFHIHDIHGEDITIVYEFFDGDKKSRFYAIKDGKRINELYKIRELIGNCVQYSVPEISAKLQVEKTRKEVIADLIKPLMPEELITKIAYHNAKVTVAFDKRRDINRELETFKKSLETVKVDPETAAIIARKDEATALMTGLREFRKTYDEAVATVEAVNGKIETETAVLRGEISLLTGSKETSKKSITDQEEAIKKAEDALELMRKKLTEMNNALTSIETNIKTKEDKITEITNKHVAEKETAEKLLVDDVEKIFELDTRIKKGEELLNSIAKAETVNSTLEPIRLKVEELQKNFDKEDKEVTDNREAIALLLQTTPLPDGLSVTDDGITIDGLQFDEDQVSESKLYIKLVELLCKVNTSQFIHAGKYDAYGKDRFDQLCKIAKANNKKIYLETVVRGQEDVKVSCFINGDSEKMLTPEEVFNMEEKQDSNKLF